MHSLRCSLCVLLRGYVVPLHLRRLESSTLEGFISYLTDSVQCDWMHIICHPSSHLLVQSTSDQFLPAWATFRTGTTFKAGLASESHWMQPMLVLTVDWCHAIVSHAIVHLRLTQSMWHTIIYNTELEIELTALKLILFEVRLRNHSPFTGGPELFHTQLFIFDWLSPCDIQSYTIPNWRSNSLLSNSLLKCDFGTTHRSLVARNCSTRNCSSPTDSVLVTYNHIQYQITDQTCCSQTHSLWSVCARVLVASEPCRAVCLEIHRPGSIKDRKEPEG
jgi:hypothetical protein